MEKNSTCTFNIEYTLSYNIHNHVINNGRRAIDYIKKYRLSYTT
jgi:hypothetical protein